MSSLEVAIVQCHVILNMSLVVLHAVSDNIK